MVAQLVLVLSISFLPVFIPVSAEDRVTCSFQTNLIATASSEQTARAFPLSAPSLGGILSLSQMQNDPGRALKWPRLL